MNLHAQSPRQTVSQLNSWLVFTGTHKLSKKLGWYTEFQFRRNGFYERPCQMQLRTAIDIKLNDNIIISPAYVATLTYPYGKQTPTNYIFFEHRPFEQVVILNKINMFYFTHRYRLEQRFIENKIWNGETYNFDKYIFKNRFRYRFLCNFPLNHKEMSDKTLFLQTWDEMFVSFGKNVGKNIFDQNRFFVGLGYKFNSKISIIGGYLNQTLFKSDGVKVEQDHTLFINFNYNIDFTKKEIIQN